jgi:hypothetical protein
MTYDPGVATAARLASGTDLGDPPKEPIRDSINDRETRRSDRKVDAGTSDNVQRSGSRTMMANIIRKRRIPETAHALEPVTMG